MLGDSRTLGTIIALGVVLALLYFNPLGVRESVIGTVDGIVGPFIPAAGSLIAAGVTIALMLYCLIRIIKP